MRDSAVLDEPRGSVEPLSFCPRPLDLLVPALSDEHQTLTIADIAEALANDQAQLWTGARSALVTQLTKYHRSGAYVIEAGPAGGDMAEILEMTPNIERWARAVGCTQVHVTAGRRGWARALRDQGYEEFAVILRKVL